MVTAQSGVGFKLFACSTDMIRNLKINNIQFMAKTTDKARKLSVFDNYDDESFQGHVS